MKKLLIPLAFVLLLVCGCNTAKTVINDSNKISKITVVGDYTNTPAQTFTAKDAVDDDQIESVTEFLNTIAVGEQTETIYGGTSVLFLIYEGDTVTKRVALYPEDSAAVIDGVTYAFHTEESLSSIFTAFDLPERQISSAEIDPLLS